VPATCTSCMPVFLTPPSLSTSAPLPPSTLQRAMHCMALPSCHKALQRSVNPEPFIQPHPRAEHPLAPAARLLPSAARLHRQRWGGRRVWRLRARRRRPRPLPPGPCGRAHLRARAGRGVRPRACAHAGAGCAPACMCACWGGVCARVHVRVRWGSSAAAHTQAVPTRACAQPREGRGGAVPRQRDPHPSHQPSNHLTTNCRRAAAARTTSPPGASPASWSARRWA
jgi:hypothetical protein